MKYQKKGQGTKVKTHTTPVFREVGMDERITLKGGEKFVVVPKDKAHQFGVKVDEVVDMTLKPGHPLTDSIRTHGVGIENIDEFRLPHGAAGRANMRDRIRSLFDHDPTLDEVRQRLLSKRAELDTLTQKYNKDQELNQRIDQGFAEVVAWGRGMTDVVLQSNECSRLHKLLESVMWWADEPIDPDWMKASVFVVKHDWCAAFGEALGEVKPGELILPFPLTCFEFRFNGKCVTCFSTMENGALGHQFFVEDSTGFWVPADVTTTGDLLVMEEAVRQIEAICVMLDSGVAETTVIRQPEALQAKRRKNGKPPLSDYHVVDLSRRHRADRNPNPEATGRKVRCHFRRGHWRHYASHKTWINWMLVGDPDLGFVDKEYRL